ncbi:unnamed protein product [Caenorhabditis brenneri]
MVMWGPLIVLLAGLYECVSEQFAYETAVLSVVTLFLSFIPYIQAIEEVPANVEEENHSQDDQHDENQDQDNDDDANDDDDTNDDDDEEQGPDGPANVAQPENANEPLEEVVPAEVIPDAEPIDEGFVDDGTLAEPVFFDARNMFYRGKPRWEPVDVPRGGRYKLWHKLFIIKGIMRMTGREIEAFEKDVKARRHLMSKNAKRKLMNDVLRCSQCHKKYNMWLHAPRLLTCGHTICWMCIFETLPFTPTDATNDKMHVMACPCCKALTGIWGAVDLLPNETVIDLIYKRKYARFKRFKRFKLRCPRCRMKYSKNVPKKVPRVSPACGHTTCECCIAESIDEFGVFACSKCRLVIRPFEPMENIFKKNYLVEALIDLM